MASPVVQEAIESNTTTAGTSHVVTLPTATNGDLLLIILDKGSTSATIDAHASLTELLDEAVANGLYIAYRQMDGTEPASYTLTSSANTRSARIAYRISGHINPSVQAPQLGTTSTGTSATPDPPASASPGSSQDYLFIACYGAAGEEADDDTWSDTPPTNYTPSPPRMKACGIAGTNLGGMIAAAERQLTTGAAENPGTFAKDSSAAWRAQTIMISPANPQQVTPSTASLTLATFAATVAVTLNQLVTPALLALALTGFAPTVTVSDPQSVTPGMATLTTTASAPTVTASDHQLATPSPANLTTSLLAPTVSVSDHQRVVPSTATITASLFAPDVTASTGSGVTATPSTASVSLTTYAPTVTATAHQSVGPDAATLTTTGLAPTVTASAHQLGTPATGSVSVSLYAPTVTVASASATVTPGVGTLVLAGYAPSVIATNEPPPKMNYNTRGLLRGNRAAPYGADSPWRAWRGRT